MGNTPLHLCVKNQYVPGVQYLIGKTRCEIVLESLLEMLVWRILRYCNRISNTFSCRCTSVQRQENVLEILLQYRVNTNISNTILDATIRLTLLTTFLEHGARLIAGGKGVISNE
jgi:hypothetical protein